MADAAVLKTAEGNLIRVRVPSSAPHRKAQNTTAPINSIGAVVFHVANFVAKLLEHDLGVLLME